MWIYISLACFWDTMDALPIKCKHSFCFFVVSAKTDKIPKIPVKAFEAKPSTSKSSRKTLKEWGKEKIAWGGKSYLTKRTIPKLIVEVLNCKQNVRSTWDSMKMLEENRFRWKYFNVFVSAIKIKTILNCFVLSRRI